MGRIDQAIQQVRGLGREIQKATARAELASAKKGVRIAQGFSSGKLSAATRKNRPFARRHGAPLADSTQIYKETGTFARSWRIKQISTVWGQSVPVIYNIASYAKFLEGGTKYAFERPVDKRIIAVLQPVRLENLNQEMSKLENKYR